MKKKLYNEEKNLLIKDLCGRLPYGVKVRHEHLSKTGILYEISMYGDITIDCGTYNHFGNINDTKPYLFPLSSMTEEQSKELEEIDPEFYSLICSNGEIYVSMDVRGYDWLNRNHFDYRGLIPKELAINCTNLNIY